MEIAQDRSPFDRPRLAAKPHLSSDAAVPNLPLGRRKTRLLVIRPHPAAAKEPAMLDAYVYDGLRTPIGRHAGALAPVRPDDLLSGVIKTLVERNPFKAQDYEDSVIGCTNQAGEDARNVGRHAALLAGLPVETAGLTLNRLCGS